MSAISTILTRLRAAIWAIDVRDDIANAIEQCYSDVSNPTLQTEALEAALQNKIDEGKMAALTIGDHTITATKLASGVIDNTLATSGAAADAKKTGDELSALKADLDAIVPGLSDTAKAALLACLAHVAWDDSDPTGQSYIDALEAALYPAANPLSAVFTQGSEKFYTFDNINSLKEHLVVTYTDEHGQTSEVTSYTLSGSLTVGMSRIAVSYGGETAYFFVNVDAISIDNNYAIGKNVKIGTTESYATKNTNQITSRCRFSQPIKNRSYTIAVADSDKYAIAGFNLDNNVLTEYEAAGKPGSTITLNGYKMSSNDAVTYAQSVTATGNYIWCSFKKNDGTDFTASEIANAYGTIYTVS